MPNTSDVRDDHLRSLKFSEVGELLSASSDTVGRLCDSGELRSFEIGTGGRRKARRVLLRDLEAYIEAKSGAPAPAPKKRRRRPDDVMDFIK